MLVIDKFNTPIGCQAQLISNDVFLHGVRLWLGSHQFRPWRQFHSDLDREGVGTRLLLDEQTVAIAIACTVQYVGRLLICETNFFAFLGRHDEEGPEDLFALLRRADVGFAAARASTAQSPVEAASRQGVSGSLA